MIVELAFGLDAKIPNLTIQRIHPPECGCKILKVYPDDADKDILIDLCALHTEEYKKMESGIVTGNTLLSGLRIDRE